jgi:hypothetical protein
VTRRQSSNGPGVAPEKVIRAVPFVTGDRPRSMIFCTTTNLQSGGDHMSKLLVVAGIAAIGAATLGTAPAEARIRCKDGYQIIRGVGLHSSPYCEIQYLAHVARRSYGVSTSFRRLRNSVDERERVCQVVGHDSRVYSTCLEYRNDSDHRRIR